MVKRFVTEYEVDGLVHGAEIDALDAEHAQSLCDEAGYGERVVGLLFLSIHGEEGPEFENMVERITAAYAEQDPRDEEAPEAEDFGCPPRRPGECGEEE